MSLPRMIAKWEDHEAVEYALRMCMEVIDNDDAMRLRINAELSRRREAAPPPYAHVNNERAAEMQEEAEHNGSQQKPR